MKLKLILFSMIVFSLMGFTWPFVHQSVSTSWLNEETHLIQPNIANINPKVLELSLVAFQKAKLMGLNKKPLITIIDYSKPATEKRLWVVDLKSGKILFNTWVTHGRNSGGNNATSFSNRIGSLKSSLGIFLTENTYVGKHGLSLKMKGLEQGINDNAYSRAIVFHGAAYVNGDVIKRYGQIGRSWGCPAISANLAKPLINTIKDHTLVFAYYPDRNWIDHSSFLTS